MIEISRLLWEGKLENEVRIIGLVETHEKHRRVEWGDHIGVVSEMRYEKDKRGGGLSFITGDREALEMEKQICGEGNSDILRCSVEIGRYKFILVMVYVDTREIGRNERIYAQLNREMESIPEGEDVLVMGDFNGHVGFLGEQERNRNGEMMLRFMEKWNLIMLNVDEKCEGVYTRVQGNERSVIDYFLASEGMSSLLDNMKIDEEKEVFDLSDHCYVSGMFNVKGVGEKMRESKWERKEYYRVNDERMMEEFVNGVENEIRGGVNGGINEFEGIIKEKAEVHLKRIYRRKINERTREILEPRWMNEEIRREIRYRRYLNRKKRRLIGYEREQYWNMYRVQKEKVKELVRKEKTKYEVEVAMEVKRNRNGKKIWEMIGKLRGDGGINKRKKLYEENGEEVPLEREGEKMIECWRKIYQRDENKAIEAWNDERRGVYERQRREGMVAVEDERIRRRDRELPGVLRLRIVEGVED